jgi:hypothetical protein
MIIAGIVLMVLGVLSGIGGFVAGFAPLFGDPPQRVDGPTSIRAEAGDQLALYRIAGFSAEGSCTVTGPDGDELDLDGVFANETLDLNGTTYVVVAEIDVESSGDQIAECSSTGFAIGPRIAVFGVVGLVLAGVFGGGLLFVIGLVLLIVGIVRRRKQPPSAFGQPGYGPPGYGQAPYGQPGYGPPPQGGPPTWTPQG